MKKKIYLLFVATLVLACMFAIGVEARTEIPDFTKVIDVTVQGEGVISPIDISSLSSAAQSDNLSRVLLRDSDGNYATYLTKYITQYKGGYGDPYQFFAYFDALNSATGKNYDVTSIIAIEIPEGTLRISNTYSQTSTWTNVMYVKAPSTLVYQQNKSYNSCSNLKVIDYSQVSITSLEQEFITNNGSVEVIYFPKEITTIGKWAIHGLSALECVYMSGTVTSAESLINNNTGSGKFVFFYTGDINSETGHTDLYTILGNANAVEVEWNVITSDSQYINTAKTEGKIYIVYNYSYCEAFNEGVHVDDGNPCVINCSLCGVTNVPKQNPDHKISTTVAYAKGYGKSGVKTSYCTNTGCNHSESVDAPALFECIGYSSPENGRDGIAIGYAINNQAVLEYTSVTKNTLKYGVFAVLKDTIGTKDIFDENGDVIDGVVNAEISEQNYVGIVFKIVGFPSEHLDTKLAMGLYTVTTDSENVEYSFVQDGTPDENEKYCFISYNEIVNVQNEENVTE